MIDETVASLMTADDVVSQEPEDQAKETKQQSPGRYKNFYCMPAA